MGGARRYTGRPAAPTRGARLCLALGRAIERVRRERNISLSTLGFHLGVSGTLVLRWEQGTRWPKVVDILELAYLFGLPVAYFLEGLDGPDLAEALLELGLVTEEQIIRARSYAYRKRHGKDDPPPYPAWDREGLGDLHEHSEDWWKG